MLLALSATLFFIARAPADGGVRATRAGVRLADPPDEQVPADPGPPVRDRLDGLEAAAAAESRGRPRPEAFGASPSPGAPRAGRAESRASWVRDSAKGVRPYERRCAAYSGARGGEGSRSEPSTASGAGSGTAAPGMVPRGRETIPARLHDVLRECGAENGVEVPCTAPEPVPESNRHYLRPGADRRARPGGQRPCRRYELVSTAASGSAGARPRGAPGTRPPAATANVRGSSRRRARPTSTEPVITSSGGAR